MNAPSYPLFAALALLLPAGLATACGDTAPPPQALPRPVVVVPLTDVAPSPPLVLTGVAQPYREAEVSFEVSGRITAILDVGRSVEVRTREKTEKEIADEIAKRKAADDDLDGWQPERLVHTGEIIAQIDDTTYRQRLEAAQLRLKTAQSGLKAQQLDLEQVAPATVARAKAQRDAARSEIASARASVQSAESNKATTGADLERNRTLFRERQIAKAEFDQYQNAYDTAVANVDKAKAGLQAAEQQAAAFEATVTEAEASLRLKAENLAQTRAQIAELVVAVDQARSDLERCVLRAPFVGRITEVHASQGDFVSAGKAVLRLTLIDPIKVSVTVSADRERRITPGTHARVRPRKFETFETQDEALFGTVFEKGAVADPATRTFRIDIMVRNARRRLVAADGATRIGFREILPAVERRFGEGGPLFVCRQCCVEEDGQHVLYRLKGGKFAQPRPAKLFEGLLDLERVVVTPVRDGPEDYMQILNWSFQRMEPAEGYKLENGDLFLNFQREDLDSAAIRKGVVFERFEWAIRPGDLVPVVFESDEQAGGAPAGFWVPDDAIRVQNEKRSVFTVIDGKAHEIPVTTGVRVDGLRHIVGAGLEAGMQLVVVGVHYVYEGAAVAVAREASLDAYRGQAR